jgi:hypothetical protein
VGVERGAERLGSSGIGAFQVSPRVPPSPASGVPCPPPPKLTPPWPSTPPGPPPAPDFWEFLCRVRPGGFPGLGAHRPPPRHPPPGLRLRRGCRVPREARVPPLENERCPEGGPELQVRRQILAGGGSAPPFPLCAAPARGLYLGVPRLPGSLGRSDGGGRGQQDPGGGRGP